MSRSPVIPAIFWREPSMADLDIRLRGYDVKTFIRGLVLKASRLDACPNLLRNYGKEGS